MLSKQEREYFNDVVNHAKTAGLHFSQAVLTGKEVEAIRASLQKKVPTKLFFNAIHTTWVNNPIVMGCI